MVKCAKWALTESQRERKWKKNRLWPVKDLIKSLQWIIQSGKSSHSPFVFPMRFGIRIRFALRSWVKRAGTAELPCDSITVKVFALISVDTPKANLLSDHKLLDFNPTKFKLYFCSQTSTLLASSTSIYNPWPVSLSCNGDLQIIQIPNSALLSTKVKESPNKGFHDLTALKVQFAMLAIVSWPIIIFIISKTL